MEIPKLPTDLKTGVVDFHKDEKMVKEPERPSSAIYDPVTGKRKRHPRKIGARNVL